MPRNLSEHHRKLAAKYGVDLDDVRGTGADGQLALDDILGAVKAKRQADYDAEMRAKREAEEMLEASRRAVHSGGAAWARNPLADKVRAEARASGRATPSRPAPTLFASGDRPAFTASGVPADVVDQLPWQARHALAAARTTQDAYEIVDLCSGKDAEETAQLFFEDHPGNQDYAARVEQWRVASLPDAALATEMGTAADAERARREEILMRTELSAEDNQQLDALIDAGFVGRRTDVG
jgi:hypothetical protein